MNVAYEILSNILRDVLPKNSNYIFQPKAEFENSYSFILVIEDYPNNQDFLKNSKLLSIIQKALNLKLSVIDKPVDIEVEVFDESD